MKIYKIKFYLICIFLFVHSSISSQNLKKADDFFKNKNFKEAYLEYERIIFSTKNNEEKILCKLKKANCYKQLGEFEKAQKTLENLNLKNLDDSLKIKIFYEIALCSYLNGDFKNAENQFLQMNFFIKDKKVLEKYYILQILNYNQLGKWKKAKEIFLLYANEKINKEFLISNINEIYDEKNFPKIKSTKRAYYLSMFIPGSGQIYAGYFKEGILSFIFHISSISLGIWEITLKNYFTSYVLGAGLLQKFYFGNLRRAEYLTEKHNYLKLKKFNENLKILIFKMKNH